MSVQAKVQVEAVDLSLQCDDKYINTSSSSALNAPLNYQEFDIQDQKGKIFLVSIEPFLNPEDGLKARELISDDDTSSTSMMICKVERSDSTDDEENIIYTGSVIKKSFTNSEQDYSLDFLERTDTEVRQAYLNRLISMKILKLQPTKKHQEVIVLDWDDTLFCTSYLGKYGFNRLPEKVIQELLILDEKAKALLENICSYGTIYIITNSDEGWVDYTGRIFLPNTYEIIKNHIEVISARKNYQDKYPDDTYRWKLEAFLQLKKGLDDRLITNILCIGDSRIEIEAARKLGERLSHSLVKTVKFKTNPGINDLIKQIDLLNQRFEYIITNRGCLTIRLEKKSN